MTVVVHIVQVGYRASADERCKYGKIHSRVSGFVVDIGNACFVAYYAGCYRIILASKIKDTFGSILIMCICFDCSPERQ